MSIELKVSGMTCGKCEEHVRRALARVPGVTKVGEVSREKGRAVVEGEAKVEALVAAVKDAGYEASE
jgi:copper chaperone